MPPTIKGTRCVAERGAVVGAILVQRLVDRTHRQREVRAGVPVGHGPVADLGPILGAWLAAHAEGTACVIGDSAFRQRSRVWSLSPELSKGLEFDLVVLIDPEAFGPGIEGAVDRYVAMTRATQRLVILTST